MLGAISFSLIENTNAFKSPETDIKKAEPLPNVEAITDKSENKALLDISRGFSKIAKLVKPAVVNISTTQIETKAEIPDLPFKMPNFPFDLFNGEMDQKPRRVQSLGSGFLTKVDDKHGYIVTNYHVVEKAKEIRVTLNDGTKVQGEIFASDERTDLVILQINLKDLPEKKRNLPTLKWGDSSKIEEGDIILTVGNPFNFGGSINMGIISSFSRDIGAQASSFVDNFIQHDAAINPGNSGGPLVNLAGEVIGVNNSIYTRSGGNMGIGFAIPASVAQKTVEQLLQHKRTIRGWLGVLIQKVDEDMAEAYGLGRVQGAAVVSITPGGPAEKADIQVQDIILEFDGKKIADNSNLARIVAETPVGKEVEIKIFRKGTDFKGKEVIVKIVLGEYEQAVKKGTILGNIDKKNEGIVKNSIIAQGIEVSELTQALREKYHIAADLNGVAVVGVNTQSNAFDLGIRAGDVIMSVTNVPTKKPEDFAQAIQAAKSHKRNVVLWLKRLDNPPVLVTLKIDHDKDETKASTTKDSDGPIIQTPKVEIPDLNSQDSQEKK